MVVFGCAWTSLALDAAGGLEEVTFVGIPLAIPDSGGRLGGGRLGIPGSHRLLAHEGHGGPGDEWEQRARAAPRCDDGVGGAFDDCGASQFQRS